MAHYRDVLAEAEAALDEAEAALDEAEAAPAQAASHVPRGVVHLPTSMGEELWKGEGSYNPQLPIQPYEACQRPSASKTTPGQI